MKDNRRQLIRVAVSALAIAPFGISKVFAQSDYFVPDILINAFLRKRFPLSRELLFLRINLTDPNLDFISKSQRLAMSTSFSAALANSNPINGQLNLSSSFTYDPTNKAIKLKEPTVDQINIKNFSSKNTQLLEQLNVWIAKILDNMTIYEFKDEEIPILKKSPSKILVEDTGLKLFFD